MAFDTPQAVIDALNQWKSLLREVLPSTNFAFRTLTEEFNPLTDAVVGWMNDPSSRVPSHYSRDVFKSLMLKLNRRGWLELPTNQQHQILASGRMSCEPTSGTFRPSAAAYRPLPGEIEALAEEAASTVDQLIGWLRNVNVLLVDLVVDCGPVQDWELATGRYRYKFGSWYSLNRQSFALLQRFVQAQEMTLTHDQIQQVCDTQRPSANLVSDLNQRLRSNLQLETNPIRPIGRGYSAYRLTMPPS